jgi:hypothetical protein
LAVLQLFLVLQNASSGGDTWARRYFPLAGSMTVPAVPFQEAG